MTDVHEDHEMHGPKWKWEWSPNTIAIVVGFGAMLIAWGYTLAEIQTGRAADAKSISEIRVELRRIEDTARVIDNHEIRITGVETRSVESSTAMRSMERAISELSSDMRLTREILERLERSLGSPVPR